MTIRIPGPPELTRFPYTTLFRSGSATINNTGSFQKSGGTGSTAIGPAFNNNGTLNVQSGTVSFYSGGDSHGTFNAAAGATLNFAGGTMTLESNSTLTAAGTVSFKIGRAACRERVKMRGGAAT